MTDLPRHLGELTIDIEHGAISGPGTGCGPDIITDLDELRDLVRHDDNGRYRPLTGTRNLPGGWQFEASDEASLADALEVIYPLALEHRRQYAAGTLRTVTLDAVFARQQGRYQVAGALSPAGQERAIALLCGECVRTPAWHGDAVPADGIPCPEPCSVLLSFCREAATWERERPSPAPVERDIPFAGFEEPGNELRERYLAP